MTRHNRNCYRICGFRRAIICGMALLLGGFLALPAQANTIVSLVPAPDSGAFPAFIFGGGPIPTFGVGPGSIGNGDGGLPLSLQSPGGLELQTPFNIAPATSYGEVNNVDGSTTFYDTTLSLGTLSAMFPAQTPFGLDVQQLTNAPFAIYGSNVGGGDGPLLLQGMLTNNEIAGVNGSSSAAVFSTTVTYTGGPIFDALVRDGGSTSSNASFNLSLIGSTLGVNGSSGYLNNFIADGQGLFNATGDVIPVVPEPSSIVLLAFGLLGIGIVAVRRRRGGLIGRCTACA